MTLSLKRVKALALRIHQTMPTKLEAAKREQWNTTRLAVRDCIVPVQHLDTFDELSGYYS